MVFNTNILAGSGGQAGDAFSPLGFRFSSNTTAGGGSSGLNFLASTGAASDANTSTTVRVSVTGGAPEINSSGVSTGNLISSNTKLTLVVWYHPEFQTALTNIFSIAGGSGGDQPGTPYSLFIWGNESSDGIQFLVQSKNGNAGYTINDIKTNVYKDNEWNCLMFSSNSEPFASRKSTFYHNDADKGNSTPSGSGGFMNLATGTSGLRQARIGAITHSGKRLKGSIAEFFYAPNHFIDFDVESNRRLFLNADGTPVNLGVDGSIPLGEKPFMYYSLREGESVSAFAENRGFGPNMTVSGTVSIFDTTPVSVSIA